MCRYRKELERFEHSYRSVWAGKVLLELHVYDPRREKESESKSMLGKSISLLKSGWSKKTELPEKVMERPVRYTADDEKAALKLRRYKLRALVLEGANLGAATADELQDMRVEVVIEDHIYQSGYPVATRAGLTTWLEEADDSEFWRIADDLHNDAKQRPEEKELNCLLTPLNKTRALEMPGVGGPVAPTLPYVFVYLTTKVDGKARRRYFAKLTCKELIEKSLGFAPSWLHLQPTQLVPTKPGVPLPALLLSIALGTETEAEKVHRFPWATLLPTAPCPTLPPTAPRLPSFPPPLAGAPLPMAAHPAAAPLDPRPMGAAHPPLPGGHAHAP